ncbi:hypothetical protein GF406_25210 [candidate division KSB1 bacterium]|nr:hypothetical protein [candidate division KSB1 bacterium]
MTIKEKIRFSGLAWLFLFVLFVGCQKAVIKPHAGNDSKTGVIKYSLIFVIHGDASYLYHDQEGKAKYADKDLVRQAIDVATHLEQSEVFIYHQRPKKRFLFFFTKDKSVFYHYKNGRLVEKGDYAREHSVATFETEAKHYQNASIRYSETPPPDSIKTIMLYYGHELPLLPERGYHASFSDIHFSHLEFASALSNFFPNEIKPIDLLVLSTCRGGNPVVVSALAPLTRFLIASPENLHLSHLGAELLSTTLANDNRSLYEKSLQFTEQAFRRLEQRTQTVVTVALYDIDEVVSYADSISEHFYQKAKAYPETFSHIEYLDCKSESLPLKGVNIFFRAPRFGRSSSRSFHSGWQCVRLIP